jgi:hypothetical protein
MTQHPITPPPELVEQWAYMLEQHTDAEVFATAARWGADQELEACCEWISLWCPKWPDGTQPEGRLRATRRPKPPSLKEQALLKTLAILDDPGRALLVEVREVLELNRRALEQLND